jgi:formylglycine-generating enzyme
MAQPSLALALWSAAGFLGSFALAVPQPTKAGRANEPGTSLAHAVPAASNPEVRAAPQLLDAMLRVPAGLYQPFYRAQAGTPASSVPRFWLDTAPVSRQSFATFVAQQGSWRRAQIDPLYAEGAYLSDWQTDLAPGDAAGTAPVVFVSWFAARAYCAWQGKRLPSVVEWEHAASSVSELQLVAATATPALWEWTQDFNSLPVDGGDGAGASLFCGAGARAKDPRDYTAFLRYAFRSSLKADYALKNLGFRCAKGAPE